MLKVMKEYSRLSEKTDRLKESMITMLNGSTNPLSPKELLAYKYDISYVGHTMAISVWEQLNYIPFNNDSLLDSKVETYKHLHLNDIPIPDSYYLAWLNKTTNQLSYSDFLSVPPNSDYNLVTNLIMKADTGFGGSGVKSLRLVRSSLKAPWVATEKEPDDPENHEVYVVQELVNCDPRILEVGFPVPKLWFPETVAPTVRVLTFRDLSGEVTTRMILKINTGNTLTDTMGHPTVWMVAIKDGQLTDRAVNILGDVVSVTKRWGLTPDEGLKDLFQEVEELAVKCAKTLPYPIVGWDIALTDKGPVVFEGNTKPTFDGIQSAHEEGFCHLVYRVGYIPPKYPYLKEARNVDIASVKSLDRWNRFRNIPILGSYLGNRVRKSHNHLLTTKIQLSDFGRNQ